MYRRSVADVRASPDSSPWTLAACPNRDDSPSIESVIPRAQARIPADQCVTAAALVVAACRCEPPQADSASTSRAPAAARAISLVEKTPEVYGG
jgi:hypothetical protein